MRLFQEKKVFGLFFWSWGFLEHILLNRVKRKVLLLGIAAGRIKACRNWDSGNWRYGAMAVNRGEMDRDSGINTAMTVYGMDFNDASALFPSRSVGVLSEP
jgi:hypothetical protein